MRRTAGFLGALLTLHLAPGSAVPPPPTPPPARAGAIEGTATVRLPPTRRVAQRYPGAGGGAARTVQAIPAVVYLKDGPAGAATGPPARATMAQRDTTFSPAVLVVPVGSTVDFPNQDPFFHNVFSYSGAKRFDLGRYPRGEAKSVVFDESGVVKVYCEVHESMRAAILVAPTRHHAPVSDDGAFRIPDVPAGTWTVTLWHAELGEVEAEVRVPEGGVARVSLELG